ncbi:class I SAM-dependent methyltransferase [Chloroflexi bacterium TSY]|nr:class I SAM-dependent methyltransferase [Chloroflexi bacterium TSY]
MEQAIRPKEDLAAVRGVPSLVWRAGQDRRLNMIVRWAYDSTSNPQSNQALATDDDHKMERVLVAGCGIGMYVKALAPYATQIVGCDIEPEHLQTAKNVAASAHLQLAACEELPYPDDYFDLTLSHEVLEHVEDDQTSVAEMVRVLKPQGRSIVFAPNRLHPFETHGHYWRGKYYFGNTPLINYLPDIWRNQLAPHVRTYTIESLRSLFIGQPVRILYHSQVYPGYDNIIQRRPKLGQWLRRITYALEQTPLTLFGNSHLLVVEKVLEL